MTIIVDTVNDTHQQPRDHAHHVWVVVDAAVDFQIIRKLARQPLHKATDSSLGTQAQHLWAALRRLPKHVVLHLVKQESHQYSLGNRHIYLHAHNVLAEHMPDGEDPPLQEDMHTHLQHLPPIPQPREPPPWVPDDRFYNDMGQAYHYPQRIRTVAHIRGSHADNTLMNHLQHKLQNALYFSALDPSLLPVHLQTQRAQLLLEQLPLLDRVARWYGRGGIDIRPEYPELLYIWLLSFEELRLTMNAHLPVVRPLLCYARRGATPMQKQNTPRIHHMPLPPPTAGDMGTLQTMPVGPRRQPAGHVDTRGHHSTTRRMGPDSATDKRGLAPDAATGDQGSGAQGSGATQALQGHRRPRPGTQSHSTPDATHRRKEGGQTAAAPRPGVRTGSTTNLPRPPYVLQPPHPLTTRETQRLATQPGTRQPPGTCHRTTRHTALHKSARTAVQ